MQHLLRVNVPDMLMKLRKKHWRCHEYAVSLADKIGPHCQVHHGMVAYNTRKLVEYLHEIASPVAETLEKRGVGDRYVEHSWVSMGNAIVDFHPRYNRRTDGDPITLLLIDQRETLAQFAEYDEIGFQCKRVIWLPRRGFRWLRVKA
ncbi:MAG: hypothetical protein QF486_05050 [Candidatus Woesearchaeota archaeon]|jgi:hypothetical protein|nr:hypothetical protein [Candidatus Woesearchaeota archaeon]MDP7181992.1 hypothetical protein [Candidatus Woesearchaeota archaeon]MDP7198956.1 hypothetical protein [Candidatus Woesearchaeota archaeon]MDP7467336.1 hypothetical protein [Candidatus Woesearchaeota archaeon]MDP7646610.1 hypothetical protein [Candidatus Woesearchaeota archaeon]